MEAGWEGVIDGILRRTSHWKNAEGITRDIRKGLPSGKFRIGEEKSMLRICKKICQQWKNEPYVAKNLKAN